MRRLVRTFLLFLAPAFVPWVAMSASPEKPTPVPRHSLPSAVSAGAKEAKHYTLYVQLTVPTEVELSTGARWMMDKGDCFPVYMFKDQQTKVIVQLASATFMLDTKKVRVLKESEQAMALASYRKDVEEFLKTQSDAWKKQAEGGTPANDQ